MEAKSKQRNLRVSPNDEQYVTRDGEKIRVLPYNFPRFSGKRTGNDRNYLKSNGTKLARLQR